MNSPSRSPKRVLIDTGGFYAFADENDVHHHEADAIFSNLVENGHYLFTTSFIVSETHALLLNRLGRRAAIQFLKDTEHGTNITVVWVTPRDVKRGREIVYTYEDKNFSLTDGTSFVVMERLRIDQAFTFDRHFAQYGFSVLTLTKP